MRLRATATSGYRHASAGGALRPTLDLRFAEYPTLDPRVTFSRSSGGTWFNSAGILQGVDFSTTSNTIGTGSKTFTLDATAGVNRYWTAGDTVLISDQANSANNMVGTVTSYNASTQVLVCNITSTGGSGTLTAWRVGSTMPRFDYNPSTLAAQGLLIEESRTNRFANASVSSATIGVGTSTAPDGNLMSKAVCPSGVAAFPNIGVGNSNTQSFTLSAGQTIDVALSGYFAAGTSGMVIEPRLIADARTAPALNFTYAELQINTSTWTVRAKSLGVDWSEVQAPSITLFRGNVYRVTWVVRYTQGATIRDGNAVSCQLRDTAGSGTFTGDGIGHFQYFGIQGETGSFPTSTIPTTTIALTRAADVASVNTLSPWFNATEGTLYAELQRYALIPSTAFANAWSISDNTNNERFILYNTGSVQTMDLAVTDGGVPQTVLVAPNAITLNTTIKTAFAYAVNDFAFVRDAGTVQTNTSGTLPTVDRLYIGANSVGTGQWTSYLRRIIYWPRAFSLAELQSITA